MTAVDAARSTGVEAPAEGEAFRAEVRSFLEAELPTGWKGVGALEPDSVDTWMAEWRRTLYERRYLALTWPRQYGGGGLGPREEVILAEEFVKAAAPRGVEGDVFGIQMVGNTILHWGSEQQKQYFLPRIVSGKDRWCQGYSEPDAGSDLAGLKCRAELVGDEWVINGQKIWTSYGHRADWIFVLCRTDSSAPRHRGISFLLCPMRQPGIEVRAIKQLNGEQEFNEVFFTDACTAAENVVGPVNEGWRVANTLLGYERGEAATTFPIVYRAEFDRLVALVRMYRKADDPVIRQRLARCYARVEIMRYLGGRTLHRLEHETTPGPESSIFKLYWSEYHQALTELAVDAIGPAALAPSGQRPRTIEPDDFGAPNDTAWWTTMFLSARAGTIYAGTSEIQRNILAERVLGLPREPAA